MAIVINHQNRFIASLVQGRRIDLASARMELARFDNIILWGFGTLGQYLFEELDKLGLRVSSIWDSAAVRGKTFRGIPIVPPLSHSFDSMQDLIIVCISRQRAYEKVLQKLQEAEALNTLWGVDLLAGLFCVGNHSGGVSLPDCLVSSICSPQECPQVKRHLCIEERGDLTASLLEVRVNRVCNLKCKFCQQYLHLYPHETSIHIPASSVCEDLVKLLAAYDFVTTLSVVGGEPFLHGDLDKILKTALNCKNLGFITIVTNGIAPIPSRYLPLLRNPRLVVNISDYRRKISAIQSMAVDETLLCLQREKIAHKIVQLDNVWYDPGGLDEQGLSIGGLVARYAVCSPECPTLMDGRYYPCPTAVTLHDLCNRKFSKDGVEVRSAMSINQIRREIIQLRTATYLDSCNYCDFSGMKPGVAGEQI